MFYKRNPSKKELKERYGNGKGVVLELLRGVEKVTPGIEGHFSAYLLQLTARSPFPSPFPTCCSIQRFAFPLLYLAPLICAGTDLQREIPKPFLVKELARSRACSVGVILDLTWGVGCSSQSVFQCV
jgi:hypothetical protein